ncbi:MAG: RDD family protein [Reichenbachiella sp.]
MPISTANFSKRLMAYNLDFTLLGILIFPISLFIEDNSIMYAVAISIVCLYHAVFESSKWQATPGKYYGKMIVVQMNGEGLSFYKALLRVLSKFLSLILFFSGFLMIYIRKDRRGLHDVIAGTRVLNIDRNTVSVNKI